MVQRHGSTAFGESYAFPGGVLDEDDRAAHHFCRGIDAAGANRLLKLADNGLDYFSAALRELFEESGVLLARDADRGWAFARHPAQRAELRSHLLDNTLAWSTLLGEHGLHLACDTLHYIGHWETPLQLARRFSTRFFVAAMPVEQSAVHNAGELTDGRWLSASEALAMADSGAMKVPFPTRRNLRYIAAHTSLSELLAWARTRSSEGIERIRPETIEIDGERRVVLPGDPGYPDGDGA